MAGKTGTGQWKQFGGQYVAWFGGCLPAEQPKYVFALIVEGEEQETIGGGKNAAPIVRKFFNDHYNKLADNCEPAGCAKAAVENVSSGTVTANDEGDDTPAVDTAAKDTRPITEAPKTKKSLLERISFRTKR